MATLGFPLPGSNLGLIIGTLGQILRQTRHRLWSNGFQKKDLESEEENILMEIVHLNHQMAVVQFLNGDSNPLPMLFSVMEGLNIAETMKDTSQLWTMYALMSAVAGFVPLHAQAQ